MAQTILVAKSDFIEGVDLRETCEEAGYQVKGPYDGLCSAMLAVQKTRPDLAILDLKLKDGSVFELARKLRDENVPIIFHSFGTSHSDVVAHFPGAESLARPCPPTRVIDTIKKMIPPV